MDATRLDKESVQLAPRIAPTTLQWPWQGMCVSPLAKGEGR